MISVIASPTAPCTSPRPYTPDFASSSSSTASVTPPRPFQPHRRLYNHHRNSPTHTPAPKVTATAASAISFNSQPLMLVPQARIHNDNDDLLRRRMYAVVPDGNNGLETLQISAISGTSGWIGDGGEGGGGGGGRWGRGRMLGGDGGRRPLTAFDYNARRKRKEIREARSRERESLVDLEDTRPTTAHPLLTRRGKMTLLLRHRPTRHRIRPSDRSVSADSGLGSPSPSAAELNDKTSHDIISVSDVFDDVTQFSTATSAESIPLLPHISGHHSRRVASSSGSSIAGGGAGGLFASYMNRHSLANDDSGYEFHGKSFRGATDEPSDVVRTPPNSEDANEEEDSVFMTLEPDDVSPFSSRVPEHLDSFSQVAEAIVGQLKRKKEKKMKKKEKASGGDENDDVFDDRWHSGRYEEGDNCPLCREFARTTRRHVDRFFGGTESFLGWIFSKWGKVSGTTSLLVCFGVLFGRL